MVCDRTIKFVLSTLLCVQVFFYISVDGEPIGRFVVGLYGNDAPVGTARFADLGELAQFRPSRVSLDSGRTKLTAIVKSNVIATRPPVQVVFTLGFILSEVGYSGHRSSKTGSIPKAR